MESVVPEITIIPSLLMMCVCWDAGLLGSPIITRSGRAGSIYTGSPFIVVMGFKMLGPDIVRDVAEGEMESVVPETTMGASPGWRVVAVGEFGVPTIMAPGCEGAVNMGWFPIVAIGVLVLPS